jgi:DNA polymerase IV
MSGAEHIFGAPAVMAERIRAAIREATGLPASVGISGTKYVAKVASGMAKPNGIEVVPPAEARAWLAPMPVKRLWGAGPVTQQRLHAAGYLRIGDRAEADPALLEQHFGSAGSHFGALARGEDPRRVATRRTARSMGSDRTLNQDVSDRREIARHLERAADRIGQRLRRKNYLAHGVRIRLKTTDFMLRSRQRRILPTDAGGDLLAGAIELLSGFSHPGPFRLVGLSAYDLERASEPQQLGLFGGGERQRRLDAAIDAVIDRFGNGAVRRARDVTGALVSATAPNLDFLPEHEEGFVDVDVDVDDDQSA